MANVGDTGNGATIVLATTSFSASVTRIQIGEITVPDLDVSTLATTGFALYISGDLKEPPEVTVDYIFATDDAQPNPGSVPETVTITAPTRTGESTAANFAGTGYVKGHKLPDFANNEVQMGQYKVKFDGDTGPTFTVSS